MLRYYYEYEQVLTAYRRSEGLGGIAAGIERNATTPEDTARDMDEDAEDTHPADVVVLRVLGRPSEAVAVQKRDLLP